VRLDAILESGHVSLDHPLVRPNREEKRDVDVDAFGNETAHRNRAFRRARDFDHHVGTIDCLPETPRFLDGGIGAPGNAG
jgi:hypothetical protein